MKRKFVLIDTKTFNHAYYEDSKRVIDITLNQIMNKGYLAKFRERPYDFIKAIDDGKEPV